MQNVRHPTRSHSQAGTGTGRKDDVVGQRGREIMREEEEEGGRRLYFITPLEVSIFLLSLTFQVPMCAMPGKVRRWFTEHLWRLYLQSLSPSRAMLHSGSPNRRGKERAWQRHNPWVPQWHSKKTRMCSFISKAPLRINTLIFSPHPIPSISKRGSGVLV